MTSIFNYASSLWVNLLALSWALCASFTSCWWRTKIKYVTAPLMANSITLMKPRAMAPTVRELLGHLVLLLVTVKIEPTNITTKADTLNQTSPFTQVGVVRGFRLPSNTKIAVIYETSVATAHTTHGSTNTVTKLTLLGHLSSSKNKIIAAISTVAMTTLRIAGGDMKNWLRLYISIFSTI